MNTLFTLTLVLVGQLPLGNGMYASRMQIKIYDIPLDKCAFLALKTTSKLERRGIEVSYSCDPQAESDQ